MKHPNFFIGMFIGALVATSAAFIGYLNRRSENQSAQVVASTADSTPVDARFFAHLQELRQNKDKLGDFLLIRDRLSAFVQEEMTREPPAFASLIEEAISLAPHIGPIVALKFESYATEEVRKAVQSLREEARVADFLKLKEQIQVMEKQVAEVKQQSLLFSSLVPVLLENTWTTSLAIFQIKNLKTKEQKIFTLSQRHNINNFVTQVVYLLPGEYEVETGDKLNPTMNKNFILVHPEPREEYGDKKYHAVIQTPHVISK